MKSEFNPNGFSLQPFTDVVSGILSHHRVVHGCALVTFILIVGVFFLGQIVLKCAVHHTRLDFKIFL